MKQENRYSVSVQSDEWGHSICDYPTKKEAIKRASFVRSNGCFFTDDMRVNEINRAVVMVYDSKLQRDVYIENFTKKYLSFRKK